jgi:hypothetical protein
VIRPAIVGTLALSTALVSCGSKGSVAVSVAIDSPTVAVLQASALAATLSGGFNLHLELGAYAPSGTDVTPREGNFSLVKPSDQTTLLVLRLSSSPAPPFHLERGAKSTVVFTITDQPGSSMQMVTKDELTSICQVKTVQIAGSFTDSTSGNATPVTSSSFDVTGCP